MTCGKLTICAGATWLLASALLFCQSSAQAQNFYGPCSEWARAAIDARNRGDQNAAKAAALVYSRCVSQSAQDRHSEYGTAAVAVTTNSPPDGLMILGFTATEIGGSGRTPVGTGGHPPKTPNSKPTTSTPTSNPTTSSTTPNPCTPTSAHRQAANSRQQAQKHASALSRQQGTSAQQSHRTVSQHGQVNNRAQSHAPSALQNRARTSSLSQVNRHPNSLATRSTAQNRTSGVRSSRTATPRTSTRSRTTGNYSRGGSRHASPRGGYSTRTANKFSSHRSNIGQGGSRYAGGFNRGGLSGGGMNRGLGARSFSGGNFGRGGFRGRR
jgi:hypothetical protein